MTGDNPSGSGPLSDELPTADEVFGYTPPSGELPTADEVFGPRSWADTISEYAKATAEGLGLLASGAGKMAFGGLGPSAVLPEDLPGKELFGPGSSRLDVPLTDAEVGALKMAAPAAAAIAGTAVAAPALMGLGPVAGPAALAALNVGTSSATRAAQAYLSPDGTLDGEWPAEAVNPANHPWQTLLDIAMPAGLGLYGVYKGRQAAAAAAAQELRARVEAEAVRRAALAEAEAVRRAAIEAAARPRELQSAVGDLLSSPEVVRGRQDLSTLAGIRRAYPLDSSLTRAELDPFRRNLPLGGAAHDPATGGVRAGMTYRREAPDVFAVGNDLPRQAPAVEVVSQRHFPEVGINEALLAERGVGAERLDPADLGFFGDTSLAYYLNRGHVPGGNPPVMPPPAPPVVPPVVPPGNGPGVSLARLGIGPRAGMAFTPEEVARAQARTPHIVGPANDTMTFLTPPGGVLERSPEPIARRFAQVFRRALGHERRIERAFSEEFANALGHIPVKDRELIRAAIEAGDLSVLPEGLRAAAMDTVERLADARRMLSEAGVQTFREGQYLPFAPTGSRQLPDIPETYFPVRYDLDGFPELRDMVLRGDMTAEDAVAQAMRSGVGNRMVQRSRAADGDVLPRREMLDELLQYSNDIARQTAQRINLGPIGEHRLGEDALRAVALIEDPRTQAMGRDLLKAYYAGGRDPVRETINPLLALMHRILGVNIWARQPSEWWKPYAMFGLRRGLRGTAAVRDSDVLSDMRRFAGAGQDGQHRWYEHMTGTDHRYLPGQLTGAVENAGRQKIGAPTGLGALMSAADDIANGRATSATRWVLEELGTSVDEVAEELARGGGALNWDLPSTRALGMDAMQAGSDTTLLQSDLYSMPTALKRGLMAGITQYKMFPLLQAQMHKRMVLDLAMEAMRTRDPALVRLLTGRLARTTASVPWQAANSFGYQGLTNPAKFMGMLNSDDDKPDHSVTQNVVRDVFSGTGGITGDLAYALAGALAHATRDPDEEGGISTLLHGGGFGQQLTNTVLPPSISRIGRDSNSAIRVAKDLRLGDSETALLRMFSLLLPYGAALDPSGRTSMLAGPFRPYLSDRVAESQYNNQ